VSSHLRARDWNVAPAAVMLVVAAAAVILRAASA
jgi:hypothetical protein